MNIGVVGLGLIGGSFAKAYKQQPGNIVYAFDADQSILDLARIAGAVDEVLNQDTIKLCNCILIALYPQATIDYLSEAAPLIAPDTVVIDCCGIKRIVCEQCFAIAKKHGFTFVGGHPMAGTQHFGFKYSRGSLFKGASMVIVPPRYGDIVFFDRIKQLLEPAGFGQITITTAEKHDRIIAITSQLAHIVSNAYIKSPTASEFKGLSAGSYKDLTRVAWLNEDMWSQLFMGNRDNLIEEIDFIINSLSEYRDALKEGNNQKLKKLLADGRKLKEKVDGR